MTSPNDIGAHGALVEVTLSFHVRTKPDETPEGLFDRVRESLWIQLTGKDGRTRLSAPLDGELFEFSVLEGATKEAEQDNDSDPK